MEQEEKTKKPHHFSKEARAKKQEDLPLEEDPTYIPNMKINHNKSYHFKQTNKAQGRSFMPREAKVWCEKTNKVRNVRYCKTESSPYVDEQSEEATAERLPIVFSDGECIIDGSNEAAIKFLLSLDLVNGKKKILPQNEAKRDSFYLVDHDANKKEDVANEEAELEAKLLIKNANRVELADFVRSVFRRSFETENELVDFAYKQARGKHKVFLENFTDPVHKLTALAQKAFQQGLLDSNKGTIKLKSTGAIVMQIDPKDKVREDEALGKWMNSRDVEAEKFKKYLESNLK